MKIAIPMEEDKLCTHFGHCRNFAVVEVDDGKNIVTVSHIPAPPHEPGLLPGWLAERGINLVIAGGIGARAEGMLIEKGIEVIIGAPQDTPENLAKAYLNRKLSSGKNLCDH
jgi:predicted Fe-Mo cluster-binding NifX family protein